MACKRATRYLVTSLLCRGKAHAIKTESKPCRKRHSLQVCVCEGLKGARQKRGREGGGGPSMYSDVICGGAGPRIKALKQKPVDVYLSFTGNEIRTVEGDTVIQSESFDQVLMFSCTLTVCSSF